MKSKTYSPRVGDRITLTLDTGRRVAVVTRVTRDMVEWKRSNPTLTPMSRVNLETRETFLRYCADAFARGARLTRKARK
jgi:hypothetical protein